MRATGFADGDDHRRRQDVSRRKVLQGMLAAAGLAAAGSGAGAWLTQSSARAAGLLLPPGARPDPSRPEGADLLPQIEHIVVYMQENHSFDNYFGTYPRVDGFTLGGDGLPINTNLDSSDVAVRAFHQASTCDVITGDHGWNGTHISWDGGAMDGFVKASGHQVMGYYDRSNLPFYWGLADTFPICDRWFSSVPGPTYPNRRFLQAATCAGITHTSIGDILAAPTAPNGTIWERLDAHGITWADYAIDVWEILLWPGADINALMADTADNRKLFPDFLADCRNGTLPQVSLIGPGVHDQYDEGSRDSQNGEAYSWAIINAVLGSPLWDRTAIFFTYDEHGGGYDHVPPPAAVAPDNIAPMLAPTDQPGDYAQYGIRVPGFVISPYAKRDYVSHVLHDHTSILKFIETKWNLGAMTYRDANADNLLDCFDFVSPGFMDPPFLPDPGLPLTGSVCQPQPYPEHNARTPATTTTTTTTPGTSVPGSTAPGTGGVLPTSTAADPVSGSPTYTG